MRYVLDSSALLNIVRTLGSRALPRIKGSYTLTLTLYEIGNALWKEATLLKRITFSESTYILNTVTQLPKFLHVVEPRNVELTLNIAYKLRITYYDASYIVVAYELNADLVTDDYKLRRRVEEGSRDLQEVLGGKVAYLRATRSSNPSMPDC
jgi:predicted nucleic acid-binding protein